jgi:predicted secreted acid phosphatase
MKKTITGCLICLIINVSAFAKLDAEPANVSLTMQAAIRYHDSGEYAKQMTYVAQEATDWFLNRLGDQSNVNYPQKLAVVFDIDETLLSNYPVIKSYFDHYLPALSRLHDGRGFTFYHKPEFFPAAIPSTQKFYNTVKAHHVAIFLISSTPERFRAYTEKKLKRAGYSGWTKLLLHPDSYYSRSTANYKSAIRKKITQKGYTIILNIGDQYSDLDGGYAEKCFKLPDPFYFIP